jgi:hypothetical protein
MFVKLPEAISARTFEDEQTPSSPASTVNFPKVVIFFPPFSIVLLFGDTPSPNRSGMSSSLYYPPFPTDEIAAAVPSKTLGRR